MPNEGPMLRNMFPGGFTNSGKCVQDCVRRLLRIDTMRSHMGNIPPVKMNTTGINRVPFGVRKVDTAEEADRKNQQVLN